MMKNWKMKKPFKGRKVYFSNSITGMPDIDGNFGWELVNFMKENGAEVLSDFVGARSKEEHIKMFAQKTGFDRYKEKNWWFKVREIDTGLVDEATHLVAVVNGPSFGVGMELERAILRPERSLPEAKILCLVEKGRLKGLSAMVRGVSSEESKDFRLQVYKDIEEAKDKIMTFLKS
jgi:hypothetical protein